MKLSVKRVSQLLKFLAVGVPAFLLALPVNYVLVDFAHFPKSLAYASVLVLQVTMNFFMCRWLVFEKVSTTKWYQDFTIFFTGIMFIRLLDWSVYMLLVSYTGLYYILAQVLNVFFFSVAKFLFSERVLT